MGSSRREKIEAMLKDEPDDIFLRYSLGMELNSEGQWESALAIFRELTQLEPPHVPAFFRCAQLLADQDQVEDSRAFLREGIEVARSQGDLHAASEMSELLAELGSLGE